MIIFALIFANGVFALSEMSLVASKKGRLQALADAGSEGARTALTLANDPNRVLATTQIGLTFITLIQGALGEARMTPYALSLLPTEGILAAYRAEIATGIVLTLITLISIIFGEMLPKRVAMLYPERIACAMSPWAAKFIRLISPAISLLSGSTNAIMKACGVPLVKADEVSAEDIEAMLEAGAQSGLLATTEKNLLDNVWRMDGRRVGALMTPRSSITYIDIQDTDNDNMDKLAAHSGQRLIVCDGGLDHVLGMGPTAKWVQSLMEQLRAGAKTPRIDWLKEITPAHCLPNTLTLIETLDAFRAHKTHAALVYNEFGQVEGIITMKDLISAVVGDMPETPEQNRLIHKDPSGKWLIDGQAPIDDVKNELGLDELPDEGANSYQTAAGFALYMVGREHKRLPKEFDKFELGEFVFEIVDIDRDKGYRIDQLMVQLKSLQSQNATPPPTRGEG